MAIKRYSATADTTISNAFKENLTTRGTGSNMGRADSLEVFSIYGQATTGSAELSRILIQFPTSEIGTDRITGVIPQSGNVSFYLKMFNAPTPFTVPRDFNLTVHAISQSTIAGAWTGFDSWQEGQGIDMDNYTDITRDGRGANWLRIGSSSAGGAVSWRYPGGDFHTDTSSSFTVAFEDGTEDLEVDITELAEQWLQAEGASTPDGNLGQKKNYGVIVKLSGSFEAYTSTADSSTTVPANMTGSFRSYYTKKFFARSSEFFFKRPVLEARWDSSTKDNRANFFYSSSLATAEENMQTLFLYNYFRGQLRNIPNLTDQKIYVSFRSGSLDNSQPTGSELKLVRDAVHVVDTSAFYVTGGVTTTAGIYTASVALTSAKQPLTRVFDIWSSEAGGTEYHTGTIDPIVLELQPQNDSTRYVSKITNLKPIYAANETVRFRVFTRQKDWDPNIYTRAISTVTPLIIDSGSYAVERIVDGFNAIPFGTGSDMHTQMSFDVSGSYFDLDMSMLEPGYSYKIKFSYYNGSVAAWREQPETFRFRVEES